MRTTLDIDADVLEIATCCLTELAFVRISMQNLWDKWMMLPIAPGKSLVLYRQWCKENLPDWLGYSQEPIDADL